MDAWTINCELATKSCNREKRYVTNFQKCAAIFNIQYSIPNISVKILQILSNTSDLPRPTPTQKQRKKTPIYLKQLPINEEVLDSFDFEFRLIIVFVD